MAIDPAVPEITNPLDDHLGYQLRRASTLVMAILADRLSELRLTIVETSILVLIDRNSGISQSEIGRILGIKRANVAPLNAALERRDLVRRTSRSGRLVGLSTTDEGHDLAVRAETLMRKNDQSLFERLDAVQRRALRDSLHTIWLSKTR